MLADVRHDEPVPAEVAARLDAALADLRSEDPGSTDQDAAVVPLRSRDHRPATGDSEERRLHRRVSRVLLAAAAVAAIGYGATQVVPDLTQSGNSGDSGSAGSVAEDEREVPGAAEQGGGDSASAEPPPAVTDLGIAGLRPLDTDDLDQSLAALRRESTRSEQFTTSKPATGLGRCGPADPVPGSRFVGAAYDGRPAKVVYLPVRNGRQRVEIYLCDAAQPRKVFQTVTLVP